MERVRIAVIGLGWFGEIHCQAISGIPGLELAALCTRKSERLAELGQNSASRKPTPIIMSC